MRRQGANAPCRPEFVKCRYQKILFLSLTAMEFTAPYTFSFHPDSVVNPESQLDRLSKLVTGGSAVDINNQLSEIMPYARGETGNFEITNDPCIQAALFRRAFISAGRHNECGTCADDYGNYSGSYINCGGWARYIIEGAGVEWPSGLSFGLNSGAGVGGPMPLPGMVLYGASRAVVELEPVSFSAEDGGTVTYPGWDFDLY